MDRTVFKPPKLKKNYKVVEWDLVIVKIKLTVNWFLYCAPFYVLSYFISKAIISSKIAAAKGWTFLNAAGKEVLNEQLLFDVATVVFIGVAIPYGIYRYLMLDQDGRTNKDRLILSLKKDRDAFFTEKAKGYD